MGSTSRAASGPRRDVAPHPVRGYLFIASAGLCWAVSATLGRAVFTGQLLRGAVRAIDPLILSQSRATISLLLLAPILLAGRGLKIFRMDRRDAMALYESCRLSVTIQGALIAAASLVPGVNLVVPVLGTAAMVHIFHAPPRSFQELNRPVR